MFFDITTQEYEDYLQRFEGKIWDIIKELEQYCEIDCISLYKVLEKFSELIWNHFNVQASSTITLSSLAIKIFRTTFLKDNIQIPTITGIIFLDLLKAYTGGAVDIYKPYGKNIKRVDVNNLYPYVIIKKEFPVGTPIQFEGDYTIILKFKNKLAIIEVEVITPAYLKHPVLIVKDDLGINIRPLGEWVGWYTSEEIKNSIKFGYKFKVKRGYLFDKAKPFKEFVEKII